MRRESGKMRGGWRVGRCGEGGWEDVVMEGGKI